MRSQDTLQNENHTLYTSEEILSTPLYTTHLKLHNSNGSSDDDLQDVNDFTSEITSPRSLQTSHDGYVTVKNTASPNQAEGSGPDSSAEQASSLVSENNSNLPAQGGSGETTQRARHQREQHFTCVSTRKHFTCTSASLHFNSRGRRCKRHRQRRQIDISYTWAHFKPWFLQHQGAKVFATHAKI